MPSSNEPAIPCRIRLCPNGCVHMQFGVATVVLPAEAYGEFVAAALHALQELRRRPAGGCPPHARDCLN